MAENAAPAQNSGMAPGSKVDTGLLMGILALAGILSLSIVAVSFVFLAKDRGLVSVPQANPQPVIVNNVMPAAVKPNPRVERQEAGKVPAGATRAPADANYINAIPGKLATPAPQRGKRKLMIQRADPSPPPYEKPAAMEGFAIRRGNPVGEGARGPLPNRISAAQRGVAQSFSPRYAIPGQVPANTSFSSMPEQELSAGIAQAAGLRVKVIRLRRSSQPLPPYGYRPLQGHEFLIAQLSMTNETDEDLLLDEGSIWAVDATDPDMGYMQNQQLAGTDFPKIIGAGETLELTSAIVFFTDEPPVGLVVHPPVGSAVHLPIVP